MTDPAELVDLDAYPMLELDSDDCRAVVATHAADLRARGVSVLPGFLRSEAISAMSDECDRLRAGAHHQDVQGTPYLEVPDESAWPTEHPRRSWERSSVHTLGYDQIPLSSPLRALYEWEPLVLFLERVLDRSPLYRYADPIGAVNIAVMEEGDMLAWHFDQTDFVVSIALQPAVSGGDFENAAYVRDSDDERYEDVAAVIRAGADHPSVVVEPMTPGTLMVFEGRRSLHRVTTVEGEVPRYVALLGYDTKPDTMSSELLKLVRYGRAEPLPATA